jgi:hypothetical protein
MERIKALCESEGEVSVVLQTWELESDENIGDHGFFSDEEIAQGQKGMCQNNNCLRSRCTRKVVFLDMSPANKYIIVKTAWKDTEATHK